MKFIHVTDIHLTQENGEVQGDDPGRNLAGCLDHIAAHHGDAELCVITGDLAHWGEPEAYSYLKRLLAGFPLPIRLMVGNHDRRDAFRAVFPETPCDTNGYIQSSEDTSAGRFIYLDTTEPMTHAGHYGPDRQTWLREELAQGGDAPCYLFMHHHPSPIGIQALDNIGQQNGAELRDILRDNKQRIAHIFFGHCHLPLSGTVCGIPFAALRGTNHHSWQDFSGHPKLKSAALTPAYNVVMIEGGDCVVHTIDFSYTGPVVEFGTAFKDWNKVEEGAA